MEVGLTDYENMLSKPMHLTDMTENNLALLAEYHFL